PTVCQTSGWTSSTARSRGKAAASPRLARSTRSRNSATSGDSAGGGELVSSVTPDPPAVPPLAPKVGSQQGGFHEKVTLPFVAAGECRGRLGGGEGRLGLPMGGQLVGPAFGVGRGGSGAGIPAAHVGLDHSAAVALGAVVVGSAA